MQDQVPSSSSTERKSPQGPGGVTSALQATDRTAARRIKQFVGLVIGLALLGAAVLAVVQDAGPIAAAFDRVTSGAWWLLALLVLLPLVHVPLTSLVFWAATPPGANGKARVGIAEMAALIAIGNLANYLPLRPGMVARIAYHRTVNGISVVESAKILATVVGSGLGAAGLLLMASLAAVQATGGAIPGLPVAVLTLPIAIGLLGVVYFRVNGSIVASVPSRWLLVVTLRYIDLVAWGVRYGLAFWAVGITLTPAQATLYAIVANVAMLVPIAGNGLGFREWAVGLVGPALPGTILGISTVRNEGLSADLLNRAGEVVTSVVLGSLAGWWLTRYIKSKAKPANTTDSAGVDIGARG